MNAKKVYEFAILRIVPKVDREEFINVGVLLFSRHLRFIGMQWHLPKDKLLMLDPDIDLDIVEAYIKGFEQICNGDKTKDGILAMEPSERFRWLTANRSSMIQTSCIHTGMTTDASHTLIQLFGKYVI